VKLFFPTVDTVAFIDRWTPAFVRHELFLPYQDGHLQGVGTGVNSHLEAARWMFEQGWFLQARNHLGDVVPSYPDEPVLRLAFGVALLKSGDRGAAATELLKVIRTAPNNEAARRAKQILADSALAADRLSP
jgi:hypothetical protein